MNDALSLERELFVPAELVFEVWTQPEHLSVWYPGEGERLEATAQAAGFELRRRSDDAVLEAVDVVEAEQASFLHWRVRRGGGALEVRVGFAGGGGTCTLSLSQQDMAGAAERDRQADLWQARLERLETYFSAI